MPHTPSCSSAKSSSILLGCKHCRLGLSKDLRYSLRSVDNQYRAAIRRTFSASFSSAGKQSSAKKLMIGSIQHGSIVVTCETPTPTLILGSATNSTLIKRGTSSVIDDAKVARESACLFYPKATWTTFALRNRLNICFTTHRYSFIRGSRALKLPYT